MKVTLAWNVWNNYTDTLLGSEVARLQNNEKKVFSELYLITQGGYPDPPTAEQARYLDAHLFVALDETSEFVQRHPKFKGAHRIASGYKRAYEYALTAGCDYACVTNGDAWFLDLPKLKALLERPDVRSHAVSARVGLVTALDMSYGDFVPFFDDHFVILNVRLCREHGVFEYVDVPRAYNANFAEYGGTHYLIGALWDEIVPAGQFNAYTHLEDCVNHFGERSGYNLLPWQYQPRYGFLHTNAAEEPSMEKLRAELLNHLGVGHYPTVAEYSASFPRSRTEFVRTADYVAFRQPPLRKLKIRLMFEIIRCYYRVLRAWRYAKVARIKRDLFDRTPGTLHYFDKYWDVLPIHLASRVYRS